MIVNNGGHTLSPYAGEGNCLNDLADLRAPFQARGIGLTSVKRSVPWLLEKNVSAFCQMLCHRYDLLCAGVIPPPALSQS